MAKPMEGTWFGNFYLTDILWGEHTQLTFIRRMLP
jgi:hypothetical protein